ncbi:MAG: hypothetical protein KDB90_02225 [Planctomycetes bacterium]|nr:hypothetical protein [Planctomycetota bacterium]
MRIRSVIPMAAVLMLGLAVTVQAQNAGRVKIGGNAAKDQPDKEAERKSRESSPEAKSDRDQPELPTLKVYEWGVATMNWDGSDEGADDVPAFYYDASEVPVEAAPVAEPKPQPDDGPAPVRPPIKIRKPVVYFECDRDLVFDLDVHFTKGKLTWMFPKPNRLTDASTVQWDNIKLYSDELPRDKFAPPELHDVDASHWAGFSRDGSTSSLVVNDEHERFLFYEGTQDGLPDADIFRDADGNIIVRNYTAHELLDLRIHFGDDYWHAPAVPAASGDKPGSLTLTEAMLLDEASGTLTAETAKAGLTEAQAKVFERAWHNDFMADNSMSWRRTPEALDELMQLKLTLPAGMGSEVHRVGYVMVKNIDLTKQPEMDELVTKAVDGDAEAEKKLRASGMAGAGALRRAVGQEGVDLKLRLKLAKILGEIGASR